jgi:hypothetical protein
MLYICTEKDKMTDFGAVKNTKEQDDLNKILKLGYKEMTKRDEDLEFAESQSRVLSMKVKTRLHQKAKKTYMVLIGEILYSIIHIDFDRAKQEMYLYLEEVRRL